MRVAKPRPGAPRLNGPTAEPLALNVVSSSNKSTVALRPWCSGRSPQNTAAGIRSSTTDRQPRRRRGLARELGRISLAEALELTILIAKKEPKRLQRVAVRRLERYLQECEPTLARVTLAVSALTALAEEERREAVRVLRALVGSF